MSAVEVGRVLGTDDATPLEFWVAVAPGQHLQLDDVVAARPRSCRPARRSSIYGIVGQVRARHEGARFDSDVFLIADGILPAEVAEAAQVQVTRVVPETFVPPLPGTEVRRAVDAERDEALDLTDVERRLPAGLTRDGEPVVLDLDFIDGTKGAHVNISGISGVATKTSYATFLLYSLFNSGVLGAERDEHQGPDLQRQGRGPAVPRPRQHPARRRAARAATARSGWRRRRSGRSRVLAPPRRGDPNGTPATGARTTGVRPLYWTIADFCRQGLLPFLFADAEDERQQYTIVVQSVTAQLRHHASAGDTSDGAVRIDGRRRARSRDLVRIVESKLMPDDPDDDADPRWTGRAVGARHDQRVRAPPGVGRAPRRAPHPRRPRRRRRRTPSTSTPQQVTVVDLHMLHDRAKRFVVGVVLRQAFDAKEAAGTARAAAVRRARRAQQVRPAGLVEPDQGDPPRRRRARPQPRHDPDRRPADGQRGRAAGRRQLGRAGRRPARLRRGRTRPVRLPARRAAPAGDDPQAGLDVRVAAPPARSRCCSSSRSRRGRPGRPKPTSRAELAGHRTAASPTIPFDGLS